MNEDRKYSIITTCKGRLAHLSRSLPAMLRQPSSEVIVVDYDCPDGTAAFVATNYPAAKVVRKANAPRFNPGDARNLGAAAARGDTLVFVDADIVLADGFVGWVAANLTGNQFAKFPEPSTRQENSLQGTCVVHRQHFIQIEGYDDVLTDYGGEDLELYDRLLLAKLACRSIDGIQLAEVIAHGADDRTRFFAKEPGLGFLIGKIYRIAKGMLISQQGSFHLEREFRLRIYDEITRLVVNMKSMNQKTLRLEIKFPDNDVRGLHRDWQFTRSLVIQVDPRS